MNLIIYSFKDPTKRTQQIRVCLFREFLWSLYQLSSFWRDNLFQLLGKCFSFLWYIWHCLVFSLVCIGFGRVTSFFINLIQKCFYRCYFVYDTPAKHPRIAYEERQYIEKSLGTTVQRKNYPTPWKEILTSRIVWMIAIAQWGGIWGLFTLMTQAPTYFKYIHGWDIKMVYFCHFVFFLDQKFFFIQEWIPQWPSPFDTNALCLTLLVLRRLSPTIRTDVSNECQKIRNCRL